MEKKTLPIELSRAEQKEIIKEAITEWLESKFASFGYWVAGALLAAAFAGVVYLALVGQGWRK